METGWEDCLGESGAWLLKPLQQRLHYDKPLPVQQAVVPTVQRALLSGLPMDVCLTAPTGSGKTLCYLLPMLRLVAECKKGIDHTRLRALVLVPTKALGLQVSRELQQLTRGTSITAVCLCKDNSVKEEAEALVRSVAVVRGTRAPSPSGNAVLKTDEEEEEEEEDGAEGAGALPSSQLCYYSRADIVIATPQRLLRHLDGTRGLSLADLRLLVIDEADQVLAGNFSNFVAKVVERFEEEQLAARGDAVGTRRLVHLTYSLHKMLCSATLSSHVARTSEVRLRNCRHFVLDSLGGDINREDEGEPLQLVSSSEAKTKRKKKRGAAETEGGDEDDNDPVVALPISKQQLVRTSFALPLRLQEHVIFVEDWYRHAVLLKLIRTIIAKQRGGKSGAQKQQQQEQEESRAAAASPGDNKKHNSSDAEHDDDDADEERERDDAEFRALGHRRRRQGRTSKFATVSSCDYPSCDDDAGERILVFCRSADEARVMGHFLLSAGVQATEFTTLATENERRRALLKSSPDACVVASDALMRGVDVPNVGHVIMYSPPETLSQYVHRAGRTARAMRAGHLHILLQKNGPSGTQHDGEVAVFKALSAAVARSQPVQYERHFFMFDRPPSAADAANNSSGEKKEEEEATTDKARLLVDEADEYLKRTQARLATHWVSALENTKREAAPTGSAARAGGAEKGGVEPPAKKKRK
ncbi:ATP-dependent RNA helicase [Trypanosoma grayi]|uniref:ATP-dependent RNA helicase n=1 Tax=Trypanosoma grayi TaxID=71804 RepID=UPI0004F4B646|nr:ATP-dependent RNA helicase [Trypanosoma grayi]KEG11706.1 ATP-dependent RNA helicase [Trypanosoma grayi]